MVKIPSIEADIKMRPMDDGGGTSSFSAGSTLKLATPSTSAPVDVRVLDALSGRKAHNVGPGDDAFVVFLLVNHPGTDYSAFRSGTRFDIVDGGDVVGTGTVQARVD